MKESIAWNNFLFYASKIEGASASSSNIEPNLLPFLSSVVSDRSPILCSLKDLSWREDGIPNDTLLHLVGNNLTRLCIETCGRSEEEEYASFTDWMVRLCDSVGRLTPNLRVLYFKTYPPWRDGLPHNFQSLHTADVKLEDAKLEDAKLEAKLGDGDGENLLPKPLKHQRTQSRS